MALDLECSLLSRRRVRGRTSEHVKIGRTKSRNLFVHYGLLVILYSCVLLFMWTVTRLLNNAFPIFRNQNVPEVDEYTSYGRHLLRVRPNCTPRSVDEFPADFMSDEQRNKGGIVVHIFIACYMFVSLAYVCEVYFVPSLEILCKLVGLQHDVAGATLMALGTSAPEFATSVIGVFITDTDIGLGTVVGSLVFNLFMIIACCCFFAGREVPLHWWPLCRDCIVYLIGILGLVLVMFDNICR
ncbi:sodium/potassium/calcium exchanger 4-like, partial [Saccoglossus kowalevskii]